MNPANYFFSMMKNIMNTKIIATTYMTYLSLSVCGCDGVGGAADGVLEDCSELLEVVSSRANEFTISNTQFELSSALLLTTIVAFPRHLAVISPVLIRWYAPKLVEHL